ncbi:MAG: hypothetical protein ABMB14_07855 [Myxococcota bacterium]
MAPTPIAAPVPLESGPHALPSCAEQYPFRLVELPAAPGLYERSRTDRAFGTPALVQAIEDASFRLALEFPDADPVYVGDLSSELGGPLPPHIFHSDGRSADIGLYGTDGDQPLGAFVELAPDQLDLLKTWTLIDAFLGTGAVEHILLDQSLIDALHDWLIAEGRLSDAEAAQIFPPSSTPRLWEMSGILRAASGHRDHFHVRFRCEGP